MLAEPRRKQKYSLNPRGLEWSNDDSKFGQKLMEKMGWKKGKGLGAKEDGHQDHITVSTRMDNRGVGCTKQHSDNWLSHQEDFASILATLNSTHVTSTPSSKVSILTPDTDDTQHQGGVPAGNVSGQHRDAVSSLEEKSKSSRRRVHYKKFTKGKDLSLCRNEDLDCILGRRATDKTTQPAEITEAKAAETKTEEDDEGEEKSFGVTTVTSSTSISEYFALKMSAMKRVHSAPANLADIGQDETKHRPIVDRVEVVGGDEREGESCHEIDVEEGCIVMTATSENKRVKSRNRKSKIVSENIPLLDLNTDRSDDVVIDESKNKKKKNKTKLVKAEEDTDKLSVVLVTEALSNHGTQCGGKKSKKKETRKRLLSESECDGDEANKEVVDCAVNKVSCEETKKKKKKKCDTSGSKEKVVEEVVVDKVDVTLQGYVKTKEKRKKKESEVKEMDDNEPTDHPENLHKDCEVNETIKKKKSKKIKKNNDEIS